MRRILVILPLILCSCGKYGATILSLRTAESMIESRPDASLEILNEIDVSSVSSRRIKARHSLLLAMAYDKNYIDIQSDTIILPALKYFIRKGTADEKLKVLYYRGVVERNRGDNESAMTWYVKAARYVEKAEDKVMAGRLYTAMMIIYNNIYDLEASVKMADMANKYYLEACDTGRYVSSVLNMVSASILLRDTLTAERNLLALSQYEYKMSRRQKLIFYIKKMSISKDLAGYSLMDVYNLLSLENIDYGEVDWLMLAGKYIDFHDYDSAHSSLEHYRRYNETYSPLYYWCDAVISEHMGHYKDAAESYRLYNVLTDESDIAVFRSDTKFLEERYKAELNSIRQRLRLIISVFSILIVASLSLILLMYLGKVLKEKREEKIEFDKMYSAVLEEQNRLKRARKDTVLGKNVRAQVEERLSVLNKFVVANISGMYSKEAFEELARLMNDRDYFLESTRMSFIIAHPQFLMFLKQYDLSDKEIACCCMYCIGLNGNEISQYLQRKSYYNYSSGIRKKLKLDKKTNIDVFLRKKLHELDNGKSNFHV